MKKGELLKRIETLEARIAELEARVQQQDALIATLPRYPIVVGPTFRPPYVTWGETITVGEDVDWHNALAGVFK